MRAGMESHNQLTCCNEVHAVILVVYMKIVYMKTAIFIKVEAFGTGGIFCDNVRLVGDHELLQPAEQQSVQGKEVRTSTFHIYSLIW